MNDETMDKIAKAIRDEDANRLLDWWEKAGQERQEAVQRRLKEWFPGKVVKAKKDLGSLLDAARDERANELHPKMETS